jgi:hypothetical protein
MKTDVVSNVILIRADIDALLGLTVTEITALILYRIRESDQNPVCLGSTISTIEPIGTQETAQITTTTR